MLKQALNENSDYMKQIAFYKHNYPSIYDLQFLQQNMLVIPVTSAKVINLLHSEEYQRPDFNAMISTTVRLLDEYNITFEGRELNLCRWR